MVMFFVISRVGDSDNLSEHYNKLGIIPIGPYLELADSVLEHAQQQVLLIKEHSFYLPTFSFPSL